MNAKRKNDTCKNSHLIILHVKNCINVVLETNLTIGAKHKLVDVQLVRLKNIYLYHIYIYRVHCVTNYNLPSGKKNKKKLKANVVKFNKCAMDPLIRQKVNIDSSIYNI